MSKAPPKKVPLTARALLQRINRKLAQEDSPRKVCKTRQPADYEWGEYHLVDVGRNMLLEYKVELEPLARELGVIEGWEALAGE